MWAIVSRLQNYKIQVVQIVGALTDTQFFTLLVCAAAFHSDAVISQKTSAFDNGQKLKNQKNPYHTRILLIIFM